uniref:Uncharacterized protein n=1 Tax=Rhizophora mucronata TaxID=61149 RepID=A0A2P2N874_RHIMU
MLEVLKRTDARPFT